MVEGGGWNLADSVIRCARFLDSKCPKMGRCRAAKNGLGTSFARPSSRFGEAQESWVRVADSKLGQNQGATPRRSPCSRGREPRPRFRDSTRARGAKIAPKIPTSWQEPDRIGAQVGPRARAQIPCLRSATRPKIPRLWGELTFKNRAQDSNFVARARQNRASSRGQIPCRWRYRGRFIALRAHGALARAAALAGAAARPAQPYRGGERNTNEIPHKIPHCLARFASRARPAARLRRALCWRVRVAGSPNSKCALKQRYDKNRGVGIGRGKPGKENAIAFVYECFLQQNSSFFLFVVECRNEFEFGSKKS